MSKIKNSGLDQYGTGSFEQRQFGTVGVVLKRSRVLYNRNNRNCHLSASVVCIMLSKDRVDGIDVSNGSSVKVLLPK